MPSLLVLMTLGHPHLQEGDLLPTEKVWDAVVRSFSNQMRAAFASSSFAKETFVGGFPRLVAQLEGLLDRITRDTDVRAIASAAATGAASGSAAGAGVGVGSQGRGTSSIKIGLGVAAAAAWGRGATPPAIGADHRAQLMATLDQFQVLCSAGAFLRAQCCAVLCRAVLCRAVPCRGSGLLLAEPWPLLVLNWTCETIHRRFHD